MEFNNFYVAVVEDEDNLRTTISYAIEKEGYKVHSFKNGKELLESINSNSPDLIVSDIMMPIMDGLELCKEVQKFKSYIPFMFLTSKDEEFDKILGLELGADDYLCKPFSLKELTTRIKVILRRYIKINKSDISNDDLLCYGDIRLDLSAYTGHVNNKKIELTVTEFRLLKSLMLLPGHVKTREQLIESAYPDDSYISDRNIDCHIKRLRKKICSLNPDFNSIQTVYGMGYKFVSI